MRIGADINLAKIDQNIFDAIWNKAKREHPNIARRTIYDRIQLVRKENGNIISPRMAAFELASEMGIDVYKNIKDPSELRELREIRSNTILRKRMKETLRQVVNKKKDTIVKKKKNKSVFIVHGRETKTAEELKRMLIGLGLKPVILHEQPSGSRTVIEKLEKYSNVDYAFVILTPDDVGYCQKDAEHLFATLKKKHPVLSDIPSFMNSTHSGFVFDNFVEFVALLKERARQNVVLELGYFMARLGRKRVCCLFKGEVDIPSDVRGVVYVPFKNSVKEAKDAILTELMGAKFEIPNRKSALGKLAN